MTPSRTCLSVNGSIMRCSRAMRRIQRSGLIDIRQGFHGPPPRCNFRGGEVLTRRRRGHSVAAVLAFALALFGLAAAPEPVPSPGVVRVLFQTSRGEILVEVDTVHAPRTA